MSDSFYHITELSELNWKRRVQNILIWPCFGNFHVVWRHDVNIYTVQYMTSWNLISNVFTPGNHVTQRQQQWPTFEKIPQLQVRKSSIIPLIRDRLEFGLKQRRRKGSGDLLDVLDFLNNTWLKSYWRANKLSRVKNLFARQQLFDQVLFKKK